MNKYEFLLSLSRLLGIEQSKQTQKKAGIISGFFNMFSK